MGTQEKRKKERKKERKKGSETPELPGNCHGGNGSGVDACSERAPVARRRDDCMSRIRALFSPPVRHARVGPLTRMIARVGHTDA